MTPADEVDPASPDDLRAAEAQDGAGGASEEGVPVPAGKPVLEWTDEDWDAWIASGGGAGGGTAGEPGLTPATSAPAADGEPAWRAAPDRPIVDIRLPEEPPLVAEGNDERPWWQQPFGAPDEHTGGRGETVPNLFAADDGPTDGEPATGDAYPPGVVEADPDFPRGTLPEAEVEAWDEPRDMDPVDAGGADPAVDHRASDAAPAQDDAGEAAEPPEPGPEDELHPGPERSAAAAGAGAVVEPDDLPGPRPDPGAPLAGADDWPGEPLSRWRESRLGLAPRSPLAPAPGDAPVDPTLAGPTGDLSPPPPEPSAPGPDDTAVLRGASEWPAERAPSRAPAAGPPRAVRRAPEPAGLDEHRRVRSALTLLGLSAVLGVVIAGLVTVTVVAIGLAIRRAVG